MSLDRRPEGMRDRFRSFGIPLLDFARAALAAAVLLLASCTQGGGGGGGGGPTAPSGPQLSVSVDSTSISPYGTTLITLTARGAQGEALPGRTIELSTTLGTIALTPVVTDEAGVAHSRLRGDGSEGRATVVATLAGTATEARVEVAITRAVAMTVEVRPQVIAPFGTAEIFVLLTQSDGGVPPANTRVELSTDLGRIINPSPRTDSLGVARSQISGQGDSGLATVRAVRQDTGQEASTVLEIENHLVLELTAARSSVTVGGTLTVAATVTTPNGIPAGEGSQIEFEVTGGRLSASRVATNALGIAQTQWTAPSQPATHTVRATIVGTSIAASLAVPVTAN